MNALSTRKQILNFVRGAAKDLLCGRAFLFGNSFLRQKRIELYCAFLFHKGALLKDTEGILIQQTENVQSARQIRFTNLHEIEKMEAVLKAYIFEAIEVEKAGLSVELKKTSEFTMVDEFKEILYSDEELKKAFEALTPGRQRGYLLYFSQAKQSKTRKDRIDKYRDHILSGKGLND